MLRGDRSKICTSSPLVYSRQLPVFPIAIHRADEACAVAVVRARACQLSVESSIAVIKSSI